MKLPTVVVLLFLAVTVSAHGDHGHSHDDDPTESLSGVQDLGVDNFDSVVNGAKHALVEFYAPWCGHCKRMTPEFKKLGAKIASDPKLSSKVAVAKVNADQEENKALGSKFGVRGFPTIKYFARGKGTNAPEDYSGARDYASFLKFLEEKLASDKGFARVEALDSLATKFLEADDKAAVVEEVVKAAAELTGDAKTNGELYVKAIKKASEKGVEYFQKEYERLEKIISSGKTAPKKLEEVSRKSSVLTAFLPDLDAPAAAAAGADAEDEYADDNEE